jgi:acyl-CoA thioester hydrolase
MGSPQDRPARPVPGTRADYVHFTAIPTRWMDNDIFGHVNNVQYYSYFDTAICRYLLDEGGLDPWRHEVVGMAVETGCRFHRSAAFPDLLHAGLRVGHLGTSSVRYEVGIFRGRRTPPARRATSSTSSSNVTASARSRFRTGFGSRWCG